MNGSPLPPPSSSPPARDGNEPESFRALNIPLGCEGEARRLTIKVLQAACGGGRDSIVQELFLKWNVKEDDFLFMLFSPVLQRLLLLNHTVTKMKIQLKTSFNLQFYFQDL